MKVGEVDMKAGRPCRIALNKVSTCGSALQTLKPKLVVQRPAQGSTPGQSGGHEEYDLDMLKMEGHLVDWWVRV